eukprot:TRINITY_DN2968_c0_g1_i2.p1 TRINITY_DN2968_c0_g1~~TRINITY_DN2968_c0_g1_i2.p1  ORF type:complete len:294 (-),score=58.98 TRINITY_DN2968_c0_g1_i2:346-1125(-)
MSERKEIRIGSRSSQLALIQAREVKGVLQSLYPDHEVVIREYTSVGDKVLNVSLSSIGEVGIFTKEIEIALLNKEVDIAIHSLKDLPTVLPQGLVIGAITERERVEDVAVFNPKYYKQNETPNPQSPSITLATLPPGSVVGTSSLRRVAQLKRAYKHLVFVDIRGNLNTRLSKLDGTFASPNPTPTYDAIILAYAGLSRLGMGNRIGEILSPSICSPAVGQGALAVECRVDDEYLLSLLKGTHKSTSGPLHHRPTSFVA